MPGGPRYTDSSILDQTVTSTPRTTSDFNQVLVLHNRGGAWHGLLAEIDPVKGTRILDTVSFEGQQDRDIQAWIDQRDVKAVRIILPASNVICRTCSLPETDEAQLESALQLQVETRLLGAAPMHRTGAALLPAASHASTRTGLILAWPETSMFKGPELEEEPCFIPDIAALASLVDGLHPADPLVWCDRTDGSVGLVLAQQERVLVRATQEELDPGSSTHDRFQSLLLETALQTGSTSDSAESMAERTTASVAAVQGKQVLLLPPEVLESIGERVIDTQIDAAWLHDWGICLGAALAMGDDLVLLTTFRRELPEEVPDFLEMSRERLSMKNAAALLALVAVLLLAFGPLLVHGIRLGVLSLVHPNLDAQVRSYEEDTNQATMYKAMMNEAWPMSKLLADIANNTPEGIDIESVKIGHGEPVKIRGIAKPSGDDVAAALATLMKAQLQGSGVFDEVTLRWENSETYGDRSFDISAEVKRPHFRPVYATEQDFGAWTLSSRRSGDGPGSGEAMDAPGTGTLVDAGTSSGSTDGERTASTTTRTSRTSRSSDDGMASRGNSDNQGADLTNVPTGRIPETLTEEQISTLSMDEARIKLKEVADARKHVRDEAVKERLQIEFRMIMNHMRKLRESGNS